MASEPHLVESPEFEPYRLFVFSNYWAHMHVQRRWSWLFADGLVSLHVRVSGRTSGRVLESVMYIMSLNFNSLSF